jgi:hypothetical protein
MVTRLDYANTAALLFLDGAAVNLICGAVESRGESAYFDRELLSCFSLADLFRISAVIKYLLTDLDDFAVFADTQGLADWAWYFVDGLWWALSHL